MILTHIAIGISLYALCKATVLYTSSIVNWNVSIFAKLARYDQESFFGPRVVTAKHKAPLGIKAFRDLWSLASFGQIASIIYMVYSVMASQYGMLLALPAIALGYAFYLVASFVISRYALRTDKMLFHRVIMMAAMVGFFVVAVLKLNDEAQRRFEIKPDVIVDDSKIREYERLRDSLQTENDKLTLRLDTIHDRQVRIVHIIDSLDQIRFKDKVQADKAIDFLRDFVSSK
jgi:hypothetical protein